MNSWEPAVTGRHAEIFGGDADFARSVACSVDALLAMPIAVAAAVLVRPFGALLFVLPAALLMAAGLSARRSSRRTRRQFASREEWKVAERQAVASVLGAAFVRRRLTRSARKSGRLPASQASGSPQRRRRARGAWRSRNASDSSPRKPTASAGLSPSGASPARVSGTDS